jgi:hypothetical protein
MSKNEFGASYSLFLPWDEAGGPRTEVSLICRFQPEDGPVAASEQTRQVLPGTLVAATTGPQKPPQLPPGVPSKPAQLTLQGLQAQRAEDQRAQQAIYEAAAPATMQPVPLTAASGMATAAPAAPARQMTSTTINLPNNFQMPSAAAVMNAQPPAASTPQPQYVPVPVMQQQVLPAQPALQPAALPSAATSPTNMVHQASYTTAAPQSPRAAVIPQRTSYSTTPGGQTPAMQQQTQHLMQQAALQQQLLQQQMAEQQARQQRMLQQQLPVQPAAGQLPMHPAGAATVTYPTTR